MKPIKATDKIKKAKIISTNGIGLEKFEDKISQLISKGWKVKGGLASYEESIVALLIK